MWSSPVDVTHCTLKLEKQNKLEENGVPTKSLLFPENLFSLWNGHGFSFVKRHPESLNQMFDDTPTYRHKPDVSFLGQFIISSPSLMLKS